MRRRALVIVGIAALVAIPAGILRAACVGAACDEDEGAGPRVPFCSLPEDVRSGIAAGTHEGRSVDLTVVTRSTVVRTPGGAWPTLDPPPDGRVPIAFGGTGIDDRADVPAGTGLDDIAPTLAEIIELQRSHPEVRSGEAIEEIGEPEGTQLVLVVVWMGVGSAEIEADPQVMAAFQDLSGTMDGSIGSLPADPAAILTTIGSGGLPRQHGITGTVQRQGGRVARAWSDPNVPSVIATLANDLDEARDQQPLIGLAASNATHRGLIGGDWYVSNDKDVFKVTPDSAAAAIDMLGKGFGDDDEPDLLAVALDGSLTEMQEDTESLLSVASNFRTTFAITAGGPSSSGNLRMEASEVVAALDDELGVSVIERVGSGGLFLDQRALARHDVTDDEVLAALKMIEAPDGSRLVADAFSEIAVSLARYC